MEADAEINIHAPGQVMEVQLKKGRRNYTSRGSHNHNWKSTETGDPNLQELTDYRQLETAQELTRPSASGQLFSSLACLLNILQ